MKRPKIIQIEGLDGSFKETNSKYIEQYLIDNGYNVKTLSFPQYNSESSIFIREYLSGQYDNFMDPYIISTFFAYDMFSTFNKLKKGEDYNNIDFIICDRYLGSNMIYQTAIVDNYPIDTDRPSEDIRRVNFICKLEQLYYNLKLPYPDITIYLNIIPELSYKILKTRDHMDKNEADLVYLKSVHRTGKFVSKLKGWNIVNCQYNDIDINTNNLKTKEEIFDEIKKILEDQLLNK